MYLYEYMYNKTARLTVYAKIWDQKGYLEIPILRYVQKLNFRATFISYYRLRKIPYHGTLHASILTTVYYIV